MADIIECRIGEDIKAGMQFRIDGEIMADMQCMTGEYIMAGMMQCGWYDVGLVEA